MCLTRCAAGQHSSHRRHANEDDECNSISGGRGKAVETAADLHGGDDFLGRMHGTLAATNAIYIAGIEGGSHERGKSKKEEERI